jgi:hypothetical protein
MFPFDLVCRCVGVIVHVCCCNLELCSTLGEKGGIKKRFLARETLVLLVSYFFTCTFT